MLLALIGAIALAGTPKASSQLSNADGKFPVDLAFDGRLGTAWAEGDKDNGQGQWIEIDLGKVMDLKGVSIWGGNLTEGERTFKESSRPSKLKIEVDGKALPESVRVKDEIARVDVPLTGSGRKIRITFEEVYEGYVFRDLYITEVAVNFPDNDLDVTKRLETWLTSKDAEKKATAWEAQLDAAYETAKSEGEGSKEAFDFICRSVSDGPGFVHDQILKTIPAGFRAQAVKSSKRAQKALRKLKDANGIPALNMAALRATGEESEQLAEQVEIFEAYRDLIGGQNRTNVRYWGENGFVPGALQSFGEPMGIEVDRTGRVFVADIGNNRVQVFSEEGRPERQWGGAMDVTDRWFTRGRKWYPSGAVAGEESGSWVTPIDVELIPEKERDGFAGIDALGRVQVYDGEGRPKISWKMETNREPEGGVGGEAYVAWLPKRKVLVAVMRDQAVLYNLEAEELGRFKVEGGTPNALEVSPKGRLWIAEGREIVEYSTDGFRFGTVIPYSALDQGFEDMDLTVDESGRLWVITDTGWVHVFKKPGKKEFSIRVLERPLKHPRLAVRQDVVYIVSDDRIERIDVAQMRLDQAAAEKEKQ
jgi:hypothetical protein